MNRTVIAVIGAGGWGKNLVRNYHQMPDVDLRYICDLDKSKFGSLSTQFPGAKVTADSTELFADPEVQGVVIATTAPTHFKLCEAALEAGKDVYVEKPMVLDVGHAHALIAKAKERQRILMVGHLLEYHPVINRLRDMIKANELGRVYYFYSQRLNLGTVRGDENALWSFAPHDISSILYLMGEYPTEISAHGQSYLQKKIEDVVFLNMNFGGRAMAHVHVSWLDPHKVRRLTVVGSKKMVVFDDLEANEKLKIYDKGARFNDEYDTFAEYIGLRHGDITVPYIKVGEPLRIECQHFVDCIRERRTPVSDGLDGLRVVSVLDAAQRSLDNHGAVVPIESLGELPVRALGAR
jgi:predicted dehydrogenase